MLVVEEQQFDIAARQKSLLRMNNPPIETLVWHRVSRMHVPPHLKIEAVK